MSLHGNAVTTAIDEVVKDFQLASQKYFCEEDVRWRLIQQIEAALAKQGRVDVNLQDGVSRAKLSKYPIYFMSGVAVL